MKIPPKPKAYVMYGSLVRAEDPWCNDCMKSTMVEGWAWKLWSQGVNRWGTCRGCHECGRWIYTSLKGEIVYVREWGRKSA